MEAMFDPISQNPFLHQFTKLYQEEKKVLKIMHDFTRNIASQRRKELKGVTEEGEYLPLNYFFFHEVDGRFYNDDEIRGEIDTVIFGTHDTSKTTISFTLYNLAKHPEIQEKVFEEVSFVMRNCLDKDLNDDDLCQLRFTEACIKESMRMFSPVPYLGRKIASEITTGGFTFPKDAEIIFSPYLMGRNPKYFKDPLDFIPDRFIGLDAPPLGYIPFSTGARRCMGGKVAMMAITIAISKIIRNFNVLLTPGHEEVEVLAELILSPKNGIILTFEERT